MRTQSLLSEYLMKHKDSFVLTYFIITLISQNGKKNFMQNNRSPSLFYQNNRLHRIFHSYLAFFDFYW